MARSAELERFLRSLAATGPAAYESYDLAALDLLRGDERQQAEQALYVRLAMRDGRAAEALARVGGERARQALADALPGAAQPAFQVALARALHSLDRSLGAQVIAAVLRQASAASDRALAASVASEFGPALGGVLRAALRDSDGSVRSNAAAALISIAGQGHAVGDFRHPLGLAALLCGSKLAAVSAFGEAELAAQLDGLAAHRPLAAPASEAAVAAQRRLLAAADPAERQAAIAAIPAAERSWAERSLLVGLPLNPRAAAALAALGPSSDIASGVGVAALRELLRIAKGDLATAAASALQALETSR